MDDHPSAPALPTIGALLGDVFEDFRRDPAGWLLAGLGFTLVLYAVPFFAFALAALLFVPIAVLPDRVVVDAAGLALLPLALLVGTLGVGPFLASLYRASHAAQTGGEPLGITSPFTYAGRDLGATLLVTLVFAVIVAAGSALCGLPGIAAAWFLGWSLPAVFIGRREIGAALSDSVSHARRYPWWDLGLVALAILAILVIGAIPLVGPILMVPVFVGLHTRAWRVAFGEAPPERIPPPDEPIEDRRGYARPRVESYDL